MSLLAMPPEEIAVWIVLTGVAAITLFIVLTRDE